jgi:hypothetical protein
MQLQREGGGVAMEVATWRGGRGREVISINQAGGRGARWLNISRWSLALFAFGLVGYMSQTG